MAASPGGLSGSSRRCPTRVAKARSRGGRRVKPSWRRARTTEAAVRGARSSATGRAAAMRSMSRGRKPATRVSAARAASTLRAARARGEARQGAAISRSSWCVLACVRGARPPQGRALLTLRRRCGQSTDGQTWPHALRLCEDQEEYCPAGYSSMAMLVRATAERFLPSRTFLGLTQTVRRSGSRHGRRGVRTQLRPRLRDP